MMYDCVETLLDVAVNGGCLLVIGSAVDLSTSSVGLEIIWLTEFSYDTIICVCVCVCIYMYDQPYLDISMRIYTTYHVCNMSIYKYMYMYVQCT